MPEIKFAERMATVLLASADPKVKAKVVHRIRKPLQEEVTKEYGHLFRVAPTMHFLPFAPEAGKEKDVEKLLKESIKWLKAQEDVYSAFLYELVDHDGKEKSPPRYVLAMLCEDNDVMRRLRLDSKASQLQQRLMKLCRGKTATEAGEVGINTMFLGVV